MQRLQVISSVVVLLLASTAFISLSSAATDNELDLEGIKEKIKEKINLTELQQHLPAGIELPDLDTLGNATKQIEDTQKVLKEKCIKVSGSSAAYEEASQGALTLNECIQNLVNVTQLQKEIEEATPIGELDTVFNKYCKKRELAIACVNKFTDTLEPCLEQQERENKKIIVDIFTSLLNFVCHKDGDQIALFISEKGPECLKDKQEAIMACVNATFSGYVPDKAPESIEELPIFTFGQKECNDMNALQKCVVAELEHCEESTPANLVDAMFRFVRNKTPCANMTTAASNKQVSTDGSSHLQFSLLTILTAVCLSLLFSQKH